MGVSTIVAVTVLALTKTVSPNQIFSGYSNPTVWLIFTAFLFSRAVMTTEFGMRVAYKLIRRFGRSSLALSYSIAASDLVLGPFIPSDTARGGGIMNHLLGKMLSICLFESCKPPRILAHFAFFTVSHSRVSVLCCAVHSGHKLDTPFSLIALRQNPLASLSDLHAKPAEFFFLVRLHSSPKSPQIQTVTHFVEIRVRIKTLDRQI